MLPVIGSSLVCGTVLALGLNGLFRIGLRQSATLSFEATNYRVDSLTSFIEHHGAEWGARRDVMTRLASALDQLVDTVAAHCRPKGPLTLTVSFDEFRVAAELDYDGLALLLPNERPSADAIVDSDDGVLRLAGYVIRRSVEHSGTTARHGRCQVQLAFEH
jgi:NCS2 family nucleobase:cation symporter-2